MQIQTKEELAAEILNEMQDQRKEIANTWNTNEVIAASRIALSNLYIALSNLIK